MDRDPSADFAMANKAFDLFTLAERKQALRRFADLRYSVIEDRFFDAVHWVIEQQREATHEQPSV